MLALCAMLSIDKAMKPMCQHSTRCRRFCYAIVYHELQFPKRMLTEEELKELNVFDSDSHLEAMKRYSEFRTLHSKLIKSPGLSRHIKGKSAVPLVFMSSRCNIT